MLIKVHSMAGMSDADWPEYVRLTHTGRLELAPGRIERCRARPPACRKGKAIGSAGYGATSRLKAASGSMREVKV